VDDSLRGTLLIASPALQEPTFRRTVVLVTSHSDEGAMGLVLNRPSEASVSEAVPHLEHLVADEEPVFVGGPVEPNAVTALAELTDEAEAALHVFDAIGFLPAELGDEVEAATIRARVFAGYSGWSAASSRPSSPSRRGSSSPHAPRTSSRPSPRPSGAPCCGARAPSSASWR